MFDFPATSGGARSAAQVAFDLVGHASRVRSVFAAAGGIEDAVDPLDERLTKLSAGHRPRPINGRAPSRAR
ncbi:MAG: hypothetical protein ACJ76O_07540, partial [Gaiellaceae bacterium]